MGNQGGMCCLSRQKENHVLNNELVIIREYMNVKITVKLGDIQKESGESVICLYTNPDKIPLQQNIIQSIYDNISRSINYAYPLVGYEQVYIQNLEMSAYKCITYYRVRVFESDKDLFQYYNGFRECLSQLNDEEFKDILICDCPIKQSRAFSSEVLVRSVIDFIDESKSRLNIRSITMLNCDKKSSRFLKYELIKQIEESNEPMIRKERQNKFMKFITSTKSITSEMGRQLKCDFSLQDFDLGDESKLVHALKQDQIEEQ
ncbi:unnamed protein product (macronuclear) [Paramecium tetraurelia]|uniref:Uncharacterized protein n=1 Tax=Paramecium tetraurelia TaxID=5888 RepID=A0DZD1_PARTE|nr:uncharacterized protein GSPATT00003367001 [Paramecium tetraurelia]CAK88398.1 unnamed protein product [Paramecium tetraurelia]|eukprot:XP_001455795.1 hypothetical protein (macronuclear) [Paramecium tetraurelia strain d4-2]